ncbi:MAG: hypothetical protein GWP06_18470 [Actinobacteria bacterium]|nr:hypothetical protein [Actinomycetota bacterium]
MFPASLQCGEYDNLVPTAAKDRNIWADVLFQYEYDDNINTDEDVKNPSDKYSVSPRITVCFPPPSSIFLASYRPAFLFYENAKENVEISHTLNLTLNHRFSSLLEAKLSSYYRRWQEPEESIIVVDEEGRILTDDLGQPRTSVTKRSNEYDQSSTSLNMDYRFAKRWGTELEYEYFYYDHKDTVIGEAIDRTSNTAGAALRYTVSFNPRQGQSYPTNILLGYRFTNQDYAVAGKDSDSNVAYAQYSRWFDPRFRLSLVGGYERRKFDGADTIIKPVQEEPYVNISFLSMLSRQFNASVSYGYRISETAEELFASRISQLISFGLNHQVSRWTSVQLNGSIDLGVFKVDQAVVEGRDDLIEEFQHDLDQNIFQLDLTIRRRFSDHLVFSAGWRFTDIDSEIPDNSYTRNRYNIGIDGLF